MTSITRLFTSLGFIAVAGATLAGCSGMGSSMASAPVVPAAIAVPAGNKLAFTLKGSGLLNYECRAKAEASGGAEWALVAPEAVLKDGSKVTGKQLAVAPAPTAGNIPWQLVQATPTTGAGTLAGVTYIQRINTNAGVAPSAPCTAATASTRAQVRYSADYLFYKA
jgi:hypothetical protein